MDNFSNNGPTSYDESEEYKKLRTLMHDMINQITKLDQINYKVQKGSPFTAEQVEIFNDTIVKSKKLVSELRDKIHYMEKNSKKE
ncbi:MAG: hypothetical protein KBD76_02075 [Bacteriovorax sp.]|nr:hypothetical protein [Bacteriovorax sp.]